MKRTLEEEQRARKELERIIRRVLKNMNDPTWDETNLWDQYISDHHGKDQFMTFKWPNDLRTVAPRVWDLIANIDIYGQKLPMFHADIQHPFTVSTLFDILNDLCTKLWTKRKCLPAISKTIPTDRKAVKSNELVGITTSLPVGLIFSLLTFRAEEQSLTLFTCNFIFHSPLQLWALSTIFQYYFTDPLHE